MPKSSRAVIKWYRMEACVFTLVYLKESDAYKTIERHTLSKKNYADKFFYDALSLKHCSNVSQMFHFHFLTFVWHYLTWSFSPCLWLSFLWPFSSDITYLLQAELSLWQPSIIILMSYCILILFCTNSGMAKLSLLFTFWQITWLLATRFIILMKHI